VALYLTHFSYTPESWAGLIREPRDRREELRPIFEAAGAKLIEMYFTFGKEDGVVLSEGDNVSAAAISIAAAAGGGVKSVDTQVLLTVDEMIEALHKAAEVPYQAPAETGVHA
jgi:uncharacterized protein with GYD domain